MVKKSQNIIKVVCERPLKTTMTVALIYFGIVDKRNKVYIDLETFLNKNITNLIN